MKVNITRPARDDIAAIGDRIAADNAVRAQSFVNELIDRCLSLSHNPERFPVVLETGARRVRKLTHQSYLIFYCLLGERVEVLRVVHSSRDWLPILEDTF